MPKIKKKLLFRLPSDEAILSLDCYTYRTVGKDGICRSKDCLIRQAGNIERYLGECQLYDRLLKKEPK